MKYSVRKRMRLEHFDYSKKGVYFVTICVKDRQNVLSNIIPNNVGCDAHIAPLIRLTPYGEIVKKYLDNMEGMDSYVIMPNHIHFIVIKDGLMAQSRPTTLSLDVRSLKTLVTKEIGTSLWQRSFYDHIIRNEADYLAHLQYMDENPIKWLLGKDNGRE